MESDKARAQSTPRGSKPEPPQGSCHFYIERKKRYCRFKPAKNSNYCAEHVTTLETNSERKRMVCPYDAKHTCYVDKLTHHMNRCPSRPKEMPAYYSKGVNSGNDGGEQVPTPKVTVLTVPAEELQTIIDKVNKLYEEYVKEIPVEILNHPCLREELANTTYGTAALRHRRQMASLIGHIEKLDLLRNGLCYVEMGAGKGQLSHWLHCAIDNRVNTSFVLIDRSHVRNKVECEMPWHKTNALDFVSSEDLDQTEKCPCLIKMDNLHKEEEIMKRYRMDIEHLKLGSIPTIEERPVVTYGKHLCGPATDLALRCATETLSHSEANDTISNGSQDEPQRKRHKSYKRSLAGCVIALCCHHRCTWPAYVGKEFIQRCGLTARDFQLLSSMSSWATCTWKGWSHTKKTECEQMKTGSDATNSKEGGSDVIGLKGEGDKVVDKCDSLLETRSNEIVNSTKSVTNSGDNGEAVQVNTDLTEIEKCKERNEVKEATLGSDSDVEDHEDTGKDIVNNRIKSQLTEKDREEIGRKCKHLIDYGRVKFLEDHGLTSCLKVYIEDFYTPENVVLVARRK